MNIEKVKESKSLSFIIKIAGYLFTPSHVAEERSGS